MRRDAALLAVLLAVFATGPAGAQPQDFPPDGTYHAECEGEAGAPDAPELTLSFPEVCFDGACCDLSNPTRLRLLDDQFLYDGACEDDGEEFEARIFFGEGTGPGTVVIVLRGRGLTLEDCSSAAGPDDA